MFKGISQCVPTVSLLYFGQFNPFRCSPLPLPSHHHYSTAQFIPFHCSPYTYLPPPLFNSFQYTSLYPLPAHLMLCDITDALSLSFPLPTSPSSKEQFHYCKHVLHMSLSMIMLVFVYTFIFGSIFYVWEKTSSLCLSEPGWLHSTWCPPIASIYCQTTCHYSLWLSNTPLCIYTTFCRSIHQL
jgi:hypothetical protein